MGLAQMMKLAQQVENRELRRFDVGLGMKLGGRLQQSEKREVITTTAMKDRGKFAENLPMRTITLRGGLCFWCNERYSTGHRCKNHD